MAFGVVNYTISRRYNERTSTTIMLLVVSIIYPVIVMFNLTDALWTKEKNK